MPSKSGLRAFKYRIITGRSSAIHIFYAPDLTTADRYAKAWANRRKATKLTRLRKDKNGKS